MNALSPWPKGFKRHRIVSLWDMLELKARDFLDATQLLMAIETITCKENPNETVKEVLEGGQVLAENLRNVRAACLHLSATLSVSAIDRLLERLKDKKCTFGEIGDKLNDIRDRLRDELRGTMFFVMENEHKRFYQGTLDWFEFDVAEKFSNSAAEDIEEAGKCLALGRGTACVFHLMRAMEGAVQKLGDKLNVTVIDKHNKELPWGPIVANIAAAVERMPQGKHRDQWSETCTLLYHAKQAWRNDTMHPKETYTTEQAKGVLDAVRTFLRQLATLV